MNKAFTEAAFQAVEQVTELPEDAIYLTYSEFAGWGTRGQYEINIGHLSCVFQTNVVPPELWFKLFFAEMKFANCSLQLNG